MQRRLVDKKDEDAKKTLEEKHQSRQAFFSTLLLQVESAEALLKLLKSLSLDSSSHLSVGASRQRDFFLEDL